MRAMTGLVVAVALSALGGGCASHKLGLPAFHLASDPAPVVEGLRGSQTEDMWLKEARLATPPGCSVETVKVLTESDATFTFTCFGGGLNGAAP